MDRWIILAVAIAFGVARFIVPVEGIAKEDIFKDMAHLVVGGMFGYAVGKKRWELWAIAVGLTLVEVIAFIVR